MWKQFIKDYLSFSKGERRAVLVLLGLILLVFVLPYWWPAPKPAAPGSLSPQSLQRQTGQRQLGGAYTGSDSNNGHPLIYVSPVPAIKTRLFYFDPNTLGAEGWKQLGLRDKTIQTILHYREKGGLFRRPEDMGKIYGLRPDEYTRLLPYVKMEQPVHTAQKETARAAYAPFKHYNYIYPSKPPVPRSIDVNTADTAAFIALPGIGSRLANRIVNFRDRLGGFYCVEQVAETYALPDSTFQQIKHILQCDSSAVHRININTADANTLKQHPYIRWNIANAIMAYRGQHGDYKNVEELLKIDIISPELLQKLRPYICVH